MSTLQGRSPPLPLTVAEKGVLFEQKAFGEQRGVQNRSGCYGALASEGQRSIFNDNKSTATKCYGKASPEDIYLRRRSSSSLAVLVFCSAKS